MTELADAPAAITGDDDARVSFTVNGTPVTVRRSHPHLLAALREELDITSPKDGCSPSGQCGCCTVFVDGKAIVACQCDMDKVEGSSVVTLEGIDEAERQTFADAFAACGGLQCGFCIPGIVMRAKSQIDKKGADLTREKMAPHLGAHLCRCTGYVKVLDAIEAVAQGTVCAPALSDRVGGGGAKYEAAPLTLGDRGYVDDIRVPGMLHAALHLTDHARADIVAIDASAALAAPGVEAVFTADDLPGELRVGIIYKDWPVMIPVGGRTSYAGDVLAVVVADTRDHARAAAELVEVTYDVHAPNTDARAALADTAPLSVWGTDSNVLSTSAYTRGVDFDEAFAASAFTVHETFHTQRIEHAFLEPESTVAIPTGDGGDRTLHVYSGGQGVWDDRNDIAAVLDVDPARVTVELVSNGGAFGGKEDMSNQAQTALAAWRLGRPVKCTLFARGELPDARQASSDRARVLGRLRRRRPCHRAEGPRHRRLRRVRERRHEGARARGGTRLWSVPVAVARHRDRCRADEQPGVRRVPRVRCQPGAVRDGGRARSPRRAGRHLGLGDPQAQRDPPGRGVGPRPDHGRRCRRRRGVPRSDQGVVRRGDRRRARRSGSDSG